MFRWVWVFLYNEDGIPRAVYTGSDRLADLVQEVLEKYNMPYVRTGFSAIMCSWMHENVEVAQKFLKRYDVKLPISERVGLGRRLVRILRRISEETGKTFMHVWYDDSVGIYLLRPDGLDQLLCTMTLEQLRREDLKDFILAQLKKVVSNV